MEFVQYWELYELKVITKAKTCEFRCFFLETNVSCPEFLSFLVSEEAVQD